MLRNYIIPKIMDDRSVDNLSQAFPTWNERNQVEAAQICSLTLSPQFETISPGNGLSLSLASHIQPDPTKTVCFNSPAYVLQNSPYLKPAQELLNEMVCISSAAEISFNEGRSINGRFLQLGERIKSCSSKEKESVQTKLIALLNELESRYDHYFKQMDQVIASFESMLGTGAASSYTTLTIQAMLKHFANLKDAIITQINASKDSRHEEEMIANNGMPKKESLRNLAMMQMRQVWRPLRGLPEDSVVVLRAWLFEHFLHPYPNDNEKLMLAVRTGLSRSQISNWFINARVRLWKPMIEEMYKEEFLDDPRNLNTYS
ncbi:hypothetical protein LUZ61_016304 [Rhynchospora tenuis]|uniref:Homeobox domain-containing protein n=1 Tax=Rhynchospora tenuis TaxID=198213 RepID=A0AAD5Z5A5_9POAL|nr:hypothetical protein LUZ61_016304 [Rhynchospora tenuis]